MMDLDPFRNVKRALKAFGKTLVFILAMIGIIFGLEVLKELVGVWVIIPLLVITTSALGYHFYKETR
jgi:hypothetical protein